MAKVLGVHNITPKSGVSVEDFERYLVRITTEMSKWPGMKTALAKGERGHHVGAYLFFFEVESVETRNRYFPADGNRSEEAAQLMASAEALHNEWEQYAEPYSSEKTTWTDYVVIS